MDDLLFICVISIFILIVIVLFMGKLILNNSKELERLRRTIEDDYENKDNIHEYKEYFEID